MDGLNITHPAPERDWTEDFPHENGNYFTHCRICNEFFTGHKRRVVCKLCASESYQTWENMPEEERKKFLMKFIST